MRCFIWVLCPMCRVFWSEQSGPVCADMGLFWNILGMTGMWEREGPEGPVLEEFWARCR